MGKCRDKKKLTDLGIDRRGVSPLQYRVLSNGIATRKAAKIKAKNKIRFKIFLVQVRVVRVLVFADVLECWYAHDLR